MTSEEGLDASHKSLGYLLLGYFIIAPTNVYGIAADIGNVVVGESMSAATLFVISFFNITGFIVVVYSHILYLNETENPSSESDRPSLLEKEVAGNSLKFILGLASVSVLTLVYINAALVSYDFYQVHDPGLGYVGLPLIVLSLIDLGILIFNLLFSLVGPVYILLFYFLVVRR